LNVGTICVVPFTASVTSARLLTRPLKPPDLKPRLAEA
jgi:hypothetical protein